MECDSRYPYTYACDYLRALAGAGYAGTKLSRADASRLRSGIAEALGIADEEVARRLADHYKENEQALTQKAIDAWMQA